LPEETVFWQTTTDFRAAADKSPLPESVDLVVIGGGYTGLSAARAAANRGLKVAVLEAETIGWGASSRNGGMVLTGLKLGMQTVVRKYGLECARRLFQGSLEAIDLVEAIVREEQIECGFQRSGHFLAAAKPAHFEALAAEAEFLSVEFGHPSRLVPGSHQRSEVGTDAYFGGLVDEVSAGLNPAQYVAGLACAAEGSGAALCSGARVVRIDRQAGRFRLTTSRGSLSAERVFVATAGYTGQATPTLQRRIVPIGSFIIATERLRDDLARTLIPNDRMVFDSRHYLHYFRLWDQRLIFGGRAAFFPETSSTIARSAAMLRQDMLAVFPRLERARIEFAWGGTLDFAFDTMPHVGEVDGIGFALGFAGHGVALGTYLGHTAANAMIDDKLKEHPFNLGRLPGAPLGLYGGWPWFLPLIGVWHQILDLVR
jgi:glycine/D-amino acid oxidase-like deaminating enzyme